MYLSLPLPFMHLQTLSPSVVVQVLMIDLASQNFQDLRPILTEYKQVSERKKISIPEEFARREAMAREVARSPLSRQTNPPGTPKNTQTHPHSRRRWFLIRIPSLWSPCPPTSPNPHDGPRRRRSTIRSRESAGG